MNTLSHVKEVINAPMRWYLNAMAAIAVAFMTTTPVFCATIKTNLDMNTIFGGMVDIILTLATFCGALIAIGGVFSYVMSHINENPDGQTRAVRYIVVGVVLIGLETLLKTVGLIG